MKKILLAFLSALAILSCDNKEVLPIIKTPVVNFASPETIVYENDFVGIDIKISLTVPAPQAETLKVKIQNDYTTLPFVVQPAFDQMNELTLEIPKGSTEASFKIIPIDDNLSLGHKEFRLEIFALSDGLLKGSNNFFDLTILDNESLGLLKSIETTGMGYHKREYEYNHFGSYKRVLFRHNENQPLFAQNMYLYNDFGKISKIQGDVGHPQQQFLYEDGKLKKVERANHNEFLEIDEFETDESGRIQTIKHFRKLPNGELNLLGHTFFTYFSSGSVQSMTVSKYRSTGELEIVQKITYEAYSMKNNPIPYYNEIPGVLLQPTLPLKMKVEEDGQVFTYQFNYTFDALGKVTERKLTGPSGIEFTKYVYY
ncbi:hypothetical protein [Aquiflexum lacus]|uniref:hypothetical protein n=1 Tax=Aquiflexum lacus TaxID=2483805 RepID=UPI001893E6FC|nr:hypothetical protein [Aquiflexum lacus]